LTIPPPGETLHEFILSVLSGTFGEDWRAEQTALPVGEQHFVLRCFSELVSSRAATPIQQLARVGMMLSTTQTYLAIFQDDLVRSYRAFVDQRRATRPDAEYREPTAEEWAEFQQHFQLRKLELGTCGRPYGTPCQHEHACIRCPMLHIDPRQRQRLVEIIDNLRQRIGEATERRWLGEVQGLQISLDAAESKLTAADRINRTTTSGPTLVGLPSLLGRTETT
jgi:hypothetical protein